MANAALEVATGVAMWAYLALVCIFSSERNLMAAGLLSVGSSAWRYSTWGWRYWPNRGWRYSTGYLEFIHIQPAGRSLSQYMPSVERTLNWLPPMAGVCPAQLVGTSASGIQHTKKFSVKFRGAPSRGTPETKDTRFTACLKSSEAGLSSSGILASPT